MQFLPCHDTFFRAPRLASMRIGWIAAGATSLMLTACGLASGQPTANTSSSAASPSASASAATSPGACSAPQPLPDLCVGRAATSDEEQAMVAAGRAGAEAELRLTDWSQCAAGQNCFRVSDPSRAMVGTEAGAFAAGTGQYPSGGLGAFCVVFVNHDSRGWHYVNVACAQNPGFMPGREDHVYVSTGCANVRTIPSLSGTVVTCLVANTVVQVDSAPVFADGHIWWHLANRGWMAHDFLVQPIPA